MSKVDLRQLPGFKWVPNGQSNLFGPTLELFRALDEMFIRLAKKANALDHQFPTFIQAAELKKLDYFSSFPHLITFPVTLAENEENLKKFTRGPKCDNENQMQLTEISPICDCLTPAACYHFYIHYQGQDFANTKYLTTRANCYRREAYYAPLERQWNFNMREIVCLGKGEDVKSFLAEYQALATETFKALDLSVDWEIATDPFFDPGQSPKFLMQTLDPVKQEMIFNKTLSIGSINFHKNYFGDAFQIQCDGASAFSGCIAFGLERWIFAIVSRYGTDPAQWPIKEIQHV
jgi:seryl-tRNA synthetase